MFKLAVLALACLAVAHAQQSCSLPNIPLARCQCPNGAGGKQLLDFSVLTDPSNPGGYLKTTFEDFFYYFQMTNSGISPGGVDICTFGSAPQSGPAAAQVPSAGGTCYNLGLVDQQTWTITNPGSDAQSITIDFQGGDPDPQGNDRQTLLVVTCDRTQTGTPTLVVSSENPPLHYNYAINHIAACPDTTPPSPSPPSPSPPSPSPPSPSPPSPSPPSPSPPSPSPPSPSPAGSSSSSNKHIGWILTGVFLGVMFVYFAAGISINKFHLHKEGRDVVPQVEFWSSIPGYIKDGFGFTFAKIRRQEYQPL